MINSGQVSQISRKVMRSHLVSLWKNNLVKSFLQNNIAIVNTQGYSKATATL